MRYEDQPEQTNTFRTTPTGEGQRPRHIVLYNEIMRVGTISAHLDQLQAKLCGGGMDVKAAQQVSNAKEENPCFQNVLHDGPELLSGMIKEAHGRISEIEALLF